jgi:feruloyl esterase
MALVGLLGLGAGSGALAAERACEVAAIKAPANATLVSAKYIEQPVGYCRVDGYVTTTNPGPNKVNFMVAMPDSHNGRYVFTIQGGAAAFVPDPPEHYLEAGYAIASTDKGVRAAHVLDFSFRDDPAQSLDWAHRGVHVSAQASQAIAKQFYGTDKLNRFATGCSGGGDGTLMAAQKYPQDFDAYVGAAMSVSDLEIAMPWGKITQHIVRDPSAWISPEELARVE